MKSSIISFAEEVLRQGQSVERVWIIWRIVQELLYTLCCIFEARLFFTGKHQLRQFQLSPEVFWVTIDRTQQRCDCSTIIAQGDVRQSQLIVRLGFPRVCLNGIPESQRRPAIVFGD